MRVLAKLVVSRWVLGRPAVPIGLFFVIGAGAAGGQTASIEFILHEHAPIRAMNGDGSVLVGERIAGATWQPCRWTRSWGLQTLAGIPGLTGGGAWAVTPDGRCIVGEFGNGRVNGLGFRWTDRGETGGGSVWGEGVALADLPGGWTDAWALCVNADATLIGGCGSPDDAMRAVVWTGQTPGEPVRVEELAGAVSGASVQDVSRDGRVAVGVQRVSVGGHSDYRVFRWTAGVGVQDLGVRVGVFNGTTPERRVRCSADGSVVVGSSYAGSTTRGFRWTVAGGLEIIPGPDPEFPASSFVGVSDDGEVLIGSMAHPAGGGPALWTRRTGLVRLRDFLVSRGADLPGFPRWHLAQASAISGDGRMVAGSGNDAAPDDLARWLADLGWRRADLDRDDFLDFFDYSLFVERFESGSLLADFNHDGVVDGRDASDYAADFEAGT